MLNLLARNPWPSPNISGVTSDLTGCPNGGNLATSTRFLNNVDSLIAKVDYNPNLNNNISGRYYYGNSNQSFPFAQLAGGLLPGFNTVTPTRVQLVALSWVKVVNSSQVNEARVGWNRFAEGFFPQDQSFDPASIGLDTGASSFNGGLPLISVGSFSKLGAICRCAQATGGYQLALHRQLFVEGRPSRCKVRLRISPHLDSDRSGHQFPRQAQLRRSHVVPRRRAYPMGARQPAIPIGTSMKTITGCTCKTASAGPRV